MNIFNIIVTSVLIFNQTLSPDGKYMAYTTEDHDLVVDNMEEGYCQPITSDGSETILNGYASWVYYEEIFGRASDYKAFWWSPDSKKLAFYRFDNGQVPVFPIYSAQGQRGSLLNTRYPKAGEPNPVVQIGIVDMEKGGKIQWADFPISEEQYFGTPFWSADSKSLYVQWMPRVQQELKLYKVDAESGKSSCVYSESSKTWVDWLEDMLFTPKGLYMVRDTNDSWQQIYFLSYDGKTLSQLTTGENWRVSLLDVDSKGWVFFTAHRDSQVHSCLYRVNQKGKIERLTMAEQHAANVVFSEDFKTFEVDHSDINTPVRRFRYKTGSLQMEQISLCNKPAQPLPYTEIVYLTMEDGLKVPAAVTLPEDFDPSKKYPLVMEIYGGPNTAYVRDWWRNISQRKQWYYEHGVIKVVADCRASGHNGRKGLDLIYEDLLSVPVQDFLSWAKYFSQLPYVDAQRIGVEGFSFGGSMTAMLVMCHPEYFRCGIAGGGVYDWMLYDTHYTERFMNTPQNNPKGYEKAKVLNYVQSYDPSRSMLKLTHGTGDDNVHFQNTLQLIDALQKQDKLFDLMIYPDGMHGYRGEQGVHDMHDDWQFWTEYLNL
ncbi:MAG: DPP IV N-terminal domain-containing protein [Candidatus Cryptobacteroides sp.]